LRQVGQFILFMQEESGHFRSKYNETRHAFEDFESEYYPGEAILALSLLHRVDPDPQWLNAALRGVLFLEESRQGLAVNHLPNDHWLMIASAALLPQFAAAASPPISRERVLGHVLDLGRMMLNDQRLVAWIPGRQGAFTPDGGTTPSATRLEGLLALERLLPLEHPERPRVHAAIADGLRYVLRAQVETGPAKGGFTAVLPGWHLIREQREAAAEIRIDYVQHALSALIGHSQSSPARLQSRP
jgi:hypothetical protein